MEENDCGGVDVVWIKEEGSLDWMCDCDGDGELSQLGTRAGPYFY
jgi:hypothetical protein